MFKELKTAIHAQFSKISASTLFITDIDKDEIWDVYLKSFPAGTDPIFKERTEHDCQGCKSFIRAAGGVVAIVDSKVISIWDINVDSFYQEVANKMSAYVKSKAIKNVFLHDSRTVGTNLNYSEGETGPIEWAHFYMKLDHKFYQNGDNIPSLLSNTRSNFDVLKRSLEELTLESAETVLELIEQGSLYRGAEHSDIVEAFIRMKKEYTGTDEYVWVKSVALKGASKIRNTVIGSLLSDLSEGKELDHSVKSFEDKVAPTNYKRPTALITKSMRDNAQAKVIELGYESALDRRYAVTADITINNILFADRSVKKAMNVFDELDAAEPVSTRSLDKVEEVSIEDFINNIVPKADAIEVMVENKHSNSLMSLIAPKDPDSKNMLKWDNNFSWAYDGEVADSIKEHVKAAGGSVTGDLRCSLAWYSMNDLDLHLIEPNGNLISFSSMHSSNGTGRLDVDNTRGGTRKEPAVENITWANRSDLQEGKYVVKVHNYSGINSNEAGFDFEFDFKGEVISISYPRSVIGQKKVTCIEFEYTHKEGVKILESLPTSSSSKELWGINTQTFNKVTMIMNSPNHWNNNKTGNKHWFFILDKCNSGKKGRGFFNEFLNEELREHRKVFEVLGSKLKAEESDTQLSGVGFSSTQRNSAYFKVTGSFTRTVKVVF